MEKSFLIRAIKSFPDGESLNDCCPVTRTIFPTNRPMISGTFRNVPAPKWISGVRANVNEWFTIPTGLLGRSLGGGCLPVV